MRRFSQRNSLVTLNDINITPLLDLAFVLLIIFVITTPLLEKGINLDLPSGGREDKQKPNPKDIHRVEVSPQGYYVFDSKPMKLEEIATVMARDFKANPNLAMDIRADENGRYKMVADFLNKCQEIGITKISLRTDPRPRK